MREIKFRAWDKVEKAMREVIAIDFRNRRVNLIKIFPNGKPGNYWRDLAYIVLMEYIGFKDTYGNELYEGDILFDYDLGIKIVLKKDDEKGWGLLKKYLENDSFGVIGNIFEDPELVNGF